ncbi:hypothetical protein LEMLEM_LOCUS7417 [Lemmus lemmus]
MNEDKGRQPHSVPDQAPFHTGLQHNRPWLHSAQAAGSSPGAPGSSRPDQCCLGGLQPAETGSQLQGLQHARSSRPAWATVRPCQEKRC